MLRFQTHWSLRRLAATWALGLALESILLLAMFTLLVRPEPPLVEQLGGEYRGRVEVVFSRSDSVALAVRPRPDPAEPPPIPEDSFYTILHWPLNKPLLAGGGHVIKMPMSLLWIPFVYVGAVPFVLLCVTSSWLWGWWHRRAAARRA
jgi:hypothetical protein